MTLEINSSPSEIEIEQFIFDKLLNRLHVLKMHEACFKYKWYNAYD